LYFKYFINLVFSYFYHMKKPFVLLFLLVSTPFFAQSLSKNKNLFSTHTAVSSFSKENQFVLEYQKYFNSPSEFSIYNPKPGFYPAKMEPQKYYSFTNTKLLLKREMSNIKPEPIYPDSDKKETFTETVFHEVLNGIFKKK